MRSSESQLDKAVNYYLNGNFKNAQKIYKALLKKTPNDHNVIRLLGLLENKKGNEKLGVMLLEKAIHLAPEIPAYYNNLGEILRSSGKDAAAIEQYKKAITLNNSYGLALNNMGVSQINLGMMDNAITSFQKAIDINPRHLDAQLNLANALLKIKKYQDAKTTYRTILNLEPTNSAASLGLASIAFEENAYVEAQSILSNALETSPQSPSLRQKLGDLCLLRHELKQAENAYLKALSIEPHSYQALVGLGHINRKKGNCNSAIEHYNNALKINPNCAVAFNGLGNVYSDLGELELAAKNYHAALEKDPGLTTAYRHISILKKYSAEDPEIKIMERELGSTNLSKSQKMHLSFALSKAYDDIGDYQTSIQHALTANQIARQSFKYSPESDDNFFKKIKIAFSTEIFSETSSSECLDKSPIFILGMPRSGTSLVEQILSSHPDVFGAGELDIMTKLFQNELTLESDRRSLVNLKEVTQSQWSRIGNLYIEATRKPDITEKYITDKLPHNFRNIGVIKKALPHAKIIHCTRDAMDTCVSIFKTYFKNAHPYSYNLEELGRHYKSYQELMQHWHNELPDFIHVIQYEKLISDQETETRKLLSFCGLDWDEKCLDFHKTKRRVGTASNAQVREKIYSSSIHRWKKYGAALEPLHRAIFGLSSN